MADTCLYNVAVTPQLILRCGRQKLTPVSIIYTSHDQTRTEYKYWLWDYGGHRYVKICEEFFRCRSRYQALSFRKERPSFKTKNENAIRIKARIEAFDARIRSEIRSHQPADPAEHDSTRHFQRFWSLLFDPSEHDVLTLTDLCMCLNEYDDPNLAALAHALKLCESDKEFREWLRVHHQIGQNSNNAVPDS